MTVLGLAILATLLTAAVAVRSDGLALADVESRFDGVKVALNMTDACRNSTSWAPSAHAFSVLLYGKDVGALVDFRILAASLRARGATSDIVALIPRGDDMLRYCQVLVQDGVRVLAVDSLPLPPTMRSAVTMSNWEWVLDKLNAWRLTDYNKVANLDTDMMFVGSTSPEKLFDDCKGEMCMATDVVTQRDGVPQLNAGLIALTPSLWRFADMRAAIARDQHSYTYPEQEFLSSYAADPGNALSVTVLDPGWNACASENNKGIKLYHFCGPSKPRRDRMSLLEPAKVGAWAQQWQSHLFSVDGCMAQRSLGGCFLHGKCHWCPRTCWNCTAYCMDERLACSDRLFSGLPANASSGAS